MRKWIGAIAAVTPADWTPPDTVELCLRCGRGLIYRPQPGQCYCPTCGGDGPGVIYRREHAPEAEPSEGDSR